MRCLLITLILISNMALCQSELLDTWFRNSNDNDGTFYFYRIYKTSEGQFIDMGGNAVESKVAIYFTRELVDPWFGKSYFVMYLPTKDQYVNTYVKLIDENTLLVGREKFLRADTKGSYKSSVAVPRTK